MGDKQPPEEIEAHMAGPVAAALTFLELLKAGRVEEAWPLADVEWRLGRLQAWLWNNRSHPFFTDLDEEAAAGVGGAPDRWWWPSFIDSDARAWSREVPDSANWGVGTRPRLVEIDYELVVFFETGGKPLRFTEPTDIPCAMQVLLHAVDGRWLVAAINRPRYQPGWPPTFADGTPAV